jgi:putative nucleotidyltransferase with HDIG domain
MSRNKPVPSRAECLRMLKEAGVPEHIIAHSAKVAEIALRYGKAVNRKAGKDVVDLRLLEAGALTHDIGKHIGLQGGHDEEVNHGETGAEMLRKSGHPELAEIARCHMLGMIFSEGALDTWEKKLVYYADKRVNHDSEVTLDERMAYLTGRYPKGADMFRRALPLMRKLEKEIFGKSGLKK